jgi:hypothetical protein
MTVRPKHLLALSAAVLLGAIAATCVLAGLDHGEGPAEHDGPPDSLAVPVAGRPEAPSLQEVLEGQARAKGGEAAARVQVVRFELDFHDESLDVRIRLTTDRDGRGRSDVFDLEGRPIVTEAFDGHRGWTYRPATGTVQEMSEDGANAFRRNPYRTGHILTLQAMADRGIELTPALEVAEPGEAHALRLRLPDGHEVILLVDPETFQVTRRRERTALHPDLDSDESWIEERLSDFRTVRGVSFPHFWEAFDLATGKRLSRVEVRSIELDPALPQGYFSEP